MTRDSLLPLFIDLVFVSGNEVVQLDATEVFQNLELEVVTGGAVKGTLELFDREGSSLEDLMLAAGTDRRFLITYGWDTPRERDRKTVELSVTNYTPTFLANVGTSLTMELVPASVLAAVLDRKIRSAPEGELISDIVQRIAQERGWTSVIEATDGPVELPFSSSGESDHAFVKSQLLPHAINADGEGGYLFYVDDGSVLHFHTPNFEARGTKIYRFASDSSGEVKSFAPTDASLFSAAMGAGNSAFTGTESRGGVQTENAATVTGGVDARGAPTQDDAPTKLDLGTNITGYHNFASRTPDELRRLAQSRYDLFRRANVQATMEVVGTHDVRPLDFVQAEWAKTNGELHYLSGAYQVHKLRQVFGSGWTTTFEMLRGGIRAKTGTQVTAASAVVETPDALAEFAPIIKAVEELTG